MYCEVMKEAPQCFQISKADSEKAFLDFHQFRVVLSTQGLNYDPRARAYPGDEGMRINNQMHKKRRGVPMSKKQAKKLVPEGAALITPKNLKEASSTRSSRLCGDLSKLSHHLDNLKGTKDGYKHGGECAFCGEKAFTKCMVCGVALHHRPSKGPFRGKDCFMKYHNTSYFGMAYADRHLLNKTRTTWSEPSKTQIINNKRHIQEMTSTKKKKAPSTASAASYSLRSKDSGDKGGPAASNGNNKA